jgi:Na+-transporting methylmalonyl-CoA/oxaloacetate decarboxylase gamma subunit
MAVGLVITVIGMVSVFLLLVMMVGAVKLLSAIASGKFQFSRRNDRDKDIAIAIAALRHSMS